jgi:hypothetical protein
MDRVKGVAYCGLACCLCSGNSTCAGCRNEGCKDKDWCKSFHCCKEKGLKGCWECKEFPCDSKIFENPHIRAFAKFVAEYGEEKLMDALEENQSRGIIYHYDGQLVGDYNKLQSEEEVCQLLLQAL